MRFLWAVRLLAVLEARTITLRSMRFFFSSLSFSYIGTDWLTGLNSSKISLSFCNRLNRSHHLLLPPIQALDRGTEGLKRRPQRCVAAVLKPCYPKHLFYLNTDWDSRGRELYKLIQPLLLADIATPRRSVMRIGLVCPLAHSSSCYYPCRCVWIDHACFDFTSTDWIYNIAFIQY